MKISKREKYLLGILGALIICFVYYQFIYINQVKKLDAKKEEERVTKEKYDKIMKDIEDLEGLEERLKVLKVDVYEKSKKLYPIILQEKIILEIDNLLTESGLDANLGFNPITVEKVQELKSDEIVKIESSFKDLVDEYNGDKLPKGDTEENTQGSSSTETEGNTAEVTTTEKEGPTTEQLKVSVSFTGSYEEVKKFISSIENYERKIAITNISITAKSQDELAGIMNLEFHAIPKLSGEDEEYLKWTLNNVYGKEILFSSGNATGAYADIKDENSSTDVTDFAMLLKSPSSELPTLTMGKAKDDARETYVYSDNEKIEDVEMTFDEVDGKLYYKYKTSESYYPKENSNEGKVFAANSKDIVIEILSEKRDVNFDNSGVKLTIVNNTSKNVEVIIRNDDTSNPRVLVTGKGNTVNVTNK